MMNADIKQHRIRRLYCGLNTQSACFFDFLCLRRVILQSVKDERLPGRHSINIAFLSSQSHHRNS